MNYKTVYDISQNGTGNIVIVYMLMGVIALLIIYGLSPWFAKKGVVGWQSGNTTIPVSVMRAVLAVPLCLVLTVISIFILNIEKNAERLSLDYKEGRCIYGEGTVSDFKPMPADGHVHESFVMGNRKFEYSDFDLSRPGFNNTASHGGPIKEGLPVHVWFESQDGTNSIARLDVAVQSR